MPTTVPENHPVPPDLQELAAALGAPLGVEEARTRFADLVAAAETGTAALIVRGSAWVALVPLAELTRSPAACPVWTLTEARGRLGDLVAAAGRPLAEVPQILTRHRRPVAALVPALALLDRPRAADRLDVEELLRSGGTITLSYDDGAPRGVQPDGTPMHDPQPPAFTALAAGPDGAAVGAGEGRSVGEALLRVHRFGTRSTLQQYSDEPPF
ncbi:hypothetical protein [Kitasatospora kifunensis]|uniref:Prevent-host-death family protein n=1 Tax=Kitasatospora kifunensis TaxID=58351 RepID=A0A7W7RBV3_KITKI|nr:hypothetical protein [Kitasatospora kifunensis]MBB4929107.1 prevent-host-death family protein [Kitasatospora kifunensis]